MAPGPPPLQSLCPQEPGLCCPGPLYLFPCHSVVSSFAVKDCGLFCPLVRLALLLTPVSHDNSVLHSSLGELGILVSSWISGRMGQQKITLVIGETKAELRG